MPPETRFTTTLASIIGVLQIDTNKKAQCACGCQLDWLIEQKQKKNQHVFFVCSLPRAGDGLHEHDDRFCHLLGDESRGVRGRRDGVVMRAEQQSVFVPLGVSRLSLGLCVGADIVHGGRLLRHDDVHAESGGHNVCWRDASDLRPANHVRRQQRDLPDCQHGRHSLSPVGRRVRRRRSLSRRRPSVVSCRHVRRREHGVRSQSDEHRSVRAQSALRWAHSKLRSGATAGEWEDERAGRAGGRAVTRMGQTAMGITRLA